MEKQNKKTKTQLNCLSFNRNKTCFTCGLSSGFKIFNTNPFQKRFKRKFEDFGIIRLELLGSSNVMAFVRSTTPNKLTIWDDYQSQGIAELSFETEITEMKIFMDKIVVCCSDHVIVYRLTDLESVDRINTFPNQKDLISVTENDQEQLKVLAVSGPKRGEIVIKSFSQNSYTNVFKAFDQQLGQIQLNSDGTMVAISSIDGTLIKVFDCKTQNCLLQLRRGKKKANIYSIAFNEEDTLLAVTSNRGSIHFFNIPSDVREETQKKKEKRGICYGKYGMKKERSIMKSKLTNTHPNISTFIGDELIIIVLDGWYFKFLVNKKKGTVIQKEGKLFLKF
ncbi:wd-repeat protein interacting with phosphoinosides wipi -related [Anaeramoeba flamelloides]|uniref:Wd-repeat protein interacting with phosphoinosides wipi -related n=1 Tax=Anaeramoeba flamelloides TaxID=1746091 RepID=A0ABQ8X630_9EUKA|nr:wd-repeat protein interacting with phosphoinosides wipi -related [Anaeramoeba flamelloides]